MRAGDFDRRASIEYKSVQQSTTSGSEIITWLRLALVWGQAQDVLPSRSESVRQGLEVARDQVRWRMRYRSDVTSDMRVVLHGGTDTAYQIVGGPAVIGRNEVLEMMLEKFSS